MTETITEHEIEQMMPTDIASIIDRADAVYYGGGSREVILPDYLYDALRAKLKTLWPDAPQLTRVGPPRKNSSTKVRHAHSMGSLDKALTLDELKSWVIKLAEKFGNIRLHLSYKMDGLSLSLQYSQGQLIRALTRGTDGFEGQDITANVMRCEGVKSYLYTGFMPFTGYVRGELILPTAQWRLLDINAESNPRNLGNGIAQRSNGEDCERLQFFPFRIFDMEGKALAQYEHAMTDMMTKMGMTPATAPFIFGPSGDHISDLKAVELEYEMLVGTDTVPGLREMLGYPIDGLVIKIDSVATQLSLGETSHCPGGQIALKFPPPGVVTCLRKVELNLGHTGAITPVGIFDPVRLGGATITRATLCNFQEISRLGIAVGDQVRVTKQGDIIPKIVAKVSDGKTREMVLEPKVCPFTGGPVGHMENVDGTKSAALYSLNSYESAPVRIAKILKWVRELDIQGMGEILVAALYHAKIDNKPILRTPADLYRIKDTGIKQYYDEATKRTIIGASEMAKILANIEAKRVIDLSLFIGALGIPQLGKSRVQSVREAMPGDFDTLNDWFSGKLVLNADKLKLPNVAAKIQKGLEEAKPLMEDLRAAGVAIIEQLTTPTPAGMVFCLTGDFPNGKDYYHEVITRAGHKFSNTFTKKTTHVVTVSPDTQQTVKAKKAREKGLPVITPEELMTLLDVE